MQETDIAGEFKRIFLNLQTEKIIPFLKGLKLKDKKVLVPVLKESKPSRDGEDKIFGAACLVCCSMSRFRSFTRWVSGDLTGLFDEVLEWYCPKWFSDYYNKYAEDTFFSLPYTHLLRWTRKGYLQPSSVLIARNLACVPGKSLKSRTDILEQDPITLDEHIWYLFLYNTGISWNDERDSNGKTRKGFWTEAFEKYTASGRISRNRVLRECLLTTCRDMPKETIGWFVDLIGTLSPAKEELVSLQEDLFAALSCPYSKPVNKVLNEIKKISSGKDFMADGFLIQLNVLVSSEIKSVVLSTLAILDKAAKEQPDKRESICAATAPVFMSKDEDIQSKAAALIINYSNTRMETVRDALLPYSGYMMMSVKNTLADYTGTPDETGPAPGTEQPLMVISDENRIPGTDNFENLVFYLSNVFNNHTPCYLDMLPALLIRFNSQVTAGNLDQLHILFRKAYQTVLSEPFWHSHHPRTNEFENTFFMSSLYDNLLALFIINYAQYTYRKFPDESAGMLMLHEETIAADRKRKNRKYFEYKPQVTALEDWHGKEYPVYRTYHRIMLAALSFIEQDIDLPLLSTPTHTPAWITAETLIGRISRYQAKGIPLNEPDLQLALSRCIPGETGALAGMAGQHLLQTYRDMVMQFLHERESLADTCKNYQWKIAPEKKDDIYYTKRTVTEVHIPDATGSGLYAGTADNIRLCVGPADIRELVLSYPSNPGIPYALLVKDRLEFSQVPNAETRDMLQAGIEILYQLKQPVGHMSLLYLACCMLCSEKNIRNYAAEIWIERIAHGLLDPHALGEITGILLNSEWTVAKRLTDLVSGNLSGISTAHNQALEQMFVSLLSRLDRKPITNLKKLLQVYHELVALNRSQPDTGKIPYLTFWQSKIK